MEMVHVRVRWQNLRQNSKGVCVCPTNVLWLPPFLLAFNTPNGCFRIYSYSVDTICFELLHYLTNKSKNEFCFVFDHRKCSINGPTSMIPHHWTIHKPSNHRTILTAIVFLLSLFVSFIFFDYLITFSMLMITS